MHRQETLFDIEPVGPPGRYRREDNVATRHAPSLPTHITTLDGHDLVKQWATWNAERPPTVERARLAKRPKPREHSSVASRPADRLGRQMIKRYGNLPWARPETPPVVEDAAAVQRRAEMEERMAALELALARGRHDGASPAPAPSALADSVLADAELPAARAPAPAPAAAPPTPPPKPPPPPLEKIVDAFAAKQATWREHLKAQHLTSLRHGGSPALPAREMARRLYGEVSARTDHKLFRASDYLPTGGVDIRDSEYRQRISRRTWGSEKALGVDATHAKGQPESSSALAAASRAVGLRTSRSMEQLMTLCDAETRRVSDRTAKGDGGGAESVSWTHLRQVRVMPGVRSSGVL